MKSKACLIAASILFLGTVLYLIRLNVVKDNTRRMVEIQTILINAGATADGEGIYNLGGVKFVPSGRNLAVASDHTIIIIENPTDDMIKDLIEAIKAKLDVPSPGGDAGPRTLGLPLARQPAPI